MPPGKATGKAIGKFKRKAVQLEEAAGNCGRGKTGKVKCQRGAAHSSESRPEPDEQHVNSLLNHPVPNTSYHALVQQDLDIIRTQWPDIADLDPLTLDGAEPGFVAPFNVGVFDAQYKMAGFDMAYTCGVNFFWFDVLRSISPMVPLYRERVEDLAADQFDRPGAQWSSMSMTVAITFQAGDNLPKGSLLRVTPDEITHAVVLAVAKRIRSEAPKEELDQWRRMLLSVPCTFRRLDSMDEKFSEQARIRQRFFDTSKAVTLSARQMVHTVVGFKNRKMKEENRSYSAADVAMFWQQHVSKSTDSFGNKHVVDACLTIHDRLFTITGIEDMIAKSEAKLGATSPWCSVWRLQALIDRAKTPAKLTWVMFAVQDQLDTSKIRHEEVTIQALKSGTKGSLSDVALQQLKLKPYLLGQWLDEKTVAGEIKASLREIFESHSSYHAKYNPLNHQPEPDLTYMLAWPKIGKMIADFLESALYNPSSSEELCLRQALRNNRTAQETLAYQPWCDNNAEINQELARTPVAGTGAPAAAAAALPDAPAGSGGVDNEGAEEDDGPTDDMLTMAAERIVRHMLFLAVPSSTVPIHDFECWSIPCSAQWRFRCVSEHGG